MVLIEGAKLDALVCPFDKASLSGVAGELVCSNGHKFPLIGRVPSFLPDARDPVRSSFSSEWGTFDYEEDRTWGVTAEETQAEVPWAGEPFARRSRRKARARRRMRERLRSPTN